MLPYRKEGLPLSGFDDYRIYYRVGTDPFPQDYGNLNPNGHESCIPYIEILNIVQFLELVRYPTNPKVRIDTDSLWTPFPYRSRQMWRDMFNLMNEYPSDIPIELLIEASHFNASATTAYLVKYIGGKYDISSQRELLAEVPHAEDTGWLMLQVLLRLPELLGGHHPYALMLAAQLHDIFGKGLHDQPEIFMKGNRPSQLDLNDHIYRALNELFGWELDVNISIVPPTVNEIIISKDIHDEGKLQFSKEEKY